MTNETTISIPLYALQTAKMTSDERITKKRVGRFSTYSAPLSAAVEIADACEKNLDGETRDYVLRDVGRDLALLRKRIADAE